MVNFSSMKKTLFPFIKFKELDQEINQIKISKIKDYNLLSFVESYRKSRINGFIVFLFFGSIIIKRRSKFQFRNDKIKNYLFAIIEFYFVGIIYLNYLLYNYKI